MPKNPPTAFISYKWGNDPENCWVESLARDLRVAGINALLDNWEVSAGESFIDYMASKVSESDIFLFVITENSTKAAMKGLGSGGALSFEIQVAISRRISDKDFRVIGLFRSGNKVPAHFAGQRYIDFREDEAYERSLQLLIDDLLGSNKKPALGGRRFRELLAKLAQVEDSIARDNKSIDRLRADPETNIRGLDMLDNYCRSLNEMQRYKESLLREIELERGHQE